MLQPDPSNCALFPVEDKFVLIYFGHYIKLCQNWYKKEINENIDVNSKKEKMVTIWWSISETDKDKWIQTLTDVQEKNSLSWPSKSYTGSRKKSKQAKKPQPLNLTRFLTFCVIALYKCW